MCLKKKTKENNCVAGAVAPATAKEAIAELQRWTARHQAIADDHERAAASMAQVAEDAQRNRAFAQSLTTLKQQFMDLHQLSVPQQRGIAFEGFLNQMFGLFDLEPRAAYSLEREQIDGAFSFDTDDYVLEARWWKKPIGRDHLDVFAKKIERKGKNALGLYVSIQGFTKDAIDQYASGTPFITVEGIEIFMVLDGRMRLDDLLKRKKRHANETGSCYFPVQNMF